MKRIAAMTVLAASLVVPFAAQADTSAGGSRQAAGGAHMSSYVSDPYHDPRSLHSQRVGSGQILGAPMMSERAGAPPVRRGLVRPHWANGLAR